MLIKGAEPWWLHIRRSIKLSETRFHETNEARHERAMAKNLASDIATKMIVRLDIQRPPIDFSYVARHLGVTLHTTKGDRLACTYDGAMDVRPYVEQSAQPRLWANQYLESGMQRLSWAHALGHLLLHPFPESNVHTCIWNETLFFPWELEAWSFAHQLLMPLWMLERLQKEYSSKKMAELFQVPHNFIEQRLKIFID